MGAKANVRTIRAERPEGVRCAIYTRKSTEEGLDQDFNSLDAQRESAEHFIISRRPEGWVASPKHYDDAGYTGANMDRPALKALFADIEAGTVKCVVVYKYDRLSRSLFDFRKILETLKKHQVDFVSVTEPFDTRTPQGMFVVNLLLSFAELERGTTAERTRDKMRAARRKGKFIGGNLILGYDLAPKGGTLVVNPPEAEQVRTIFQMYLKLGSLIPVVEELERSGLRMKLWTTRKGRTRGGDRFNKTTLYNLLTNVAYTGQVGFEGKVLPGEHDRIIDDETFNRVQEQLKRNGPRGGRSVRNKHGGLLKGIVLCGSCGSAMLHTYSRKKDTLYRYYVCMTAHQRGWNACETKSVSATLLEGAVIDNLRRFAQQPAMLSGVLRRLEVMRQEAGETAPTEPADVQDALLKFEPVWEQLTTWEKERFIRALITEVRYDGRTERVTVGFRSEGIKELCKNE
jgi:site-specific DNA recombinase